MIPFPRASKTWSVELRTEAPGLTDNQLYELNTMLSSVGYRLRARIVYTQGGDPVEGYVFRRISITPYRRLPRWFVRRSPLWLLEWMCK